MLLQQQQLIKDFMQPKPLRYAFMVDVSGSTGSSVNYWDAVQHVFNLYANQIEHYYEWDSSITKVTKKQMQQQIISRSGKGGTSPEVVANQIIQQKYKKVILITDGQVGDESVRQCDKILEGYEFVKTICYIFASSKYGNLNMSVTCPFTRKCQNQVYEKKEGAEMKKLVQYVPEDFKILDTLDDITLENFEANYDKIQGLIIALNMGKDGNIPLKNQLVVMKNRLVKELSKQKGFDIKTQMRAHLQKGNLQGAVQIAEKITKDYFSNSMTIDLGKKINHLITLCGDMRGQYDINQIKSNKMAHAQDAKEGQIDQNVDIKELSNNLIQCPIILDEDVPQILVDQCEPILAGVQKAIVDDITSCPIRILNYPQIKAKLKARLSNFIGVKYSNKFFKNPFTQRKLLGAIPLGCHQSHVKVGNFTIAKMFSDGKILGNLNMFFAAVWHIIKQKEIEYLNEIEQNAREHLVFRLKNSNTMASLCGLPQLVTTQLHSDLAVWYCVHSGMFNQPTNRDTFRFHIYNMDKLIQIVKILGYPIDKGVQKHLYRTKSLLSLLAAYKKLSLSQKTSFKEAIRCLYQNSVRINQKNISKDVNKSEVVVKCIPIDGEASNENSKKILSKLPPFLQKLSIEEIIHIGELIDEQKLASNIPLQYNLNVKLVPVAAVNWKYGLKKAEQFSDEKYKICPQTLRLYSIYENNKWENEVEKNYQMSTKDLFKGRKYFELFLNKYKKMPNKDQLLVFYYNRYVVSKKCSTLPYQCLSWTSKIIEQYSEVLKESKLTINDAIKIMKKSTPRKDRSKMQK